MIKDIFTAISLLHDIPHASIDTQTDLQPEDILEWKIRQSDKDQIDKTNNLNKISALAMEDRMIRYQIQVDDRMKRELESNLSKFKEIELAHLRVEERKKYHREIEQGKIEHEKHIAQIEEAFTLRQEQDAKRLEDREREMERQNIELRQRVLEESRRTVLAEMTAKTDAELTAKQLLMERDSLARKHDEAMLRIAELGILKDRFSESMNEKMTQYKIDLNREHLNLISSVEIEKSRLEGIYC